MKIEKVRKNYWSSLGEITNQKKQTNKKLMCLMERTSDRTCSNNVLPSPKLKPFRQHRSKWYSRGRLRNSVWSLTWNAPQAMKRWTATLRSLVVQSLSDTWGTNFSSSCFQLLTIWPLWIFMRVDELLEARKWVLEHWLALEWRSHFQFLGLELYFLFPIIHMWRKEGICLLDVGSTLPNSLKTENHRSKPQYRTIWV